MTSEAKMCDVCSPDTGAGVVCAICADTSSEIDDDGYTGYEPESQGERAVEWAIYNG